MFISKFIFPFHRSTVKFLPALMFMKDIIFPILSSSAAHVLSLSLNQSFLALVSLRLEGFPQVNTIYMFQSPNV